MEQNHAPTNPPAVALDASIEAAIAQYESKLLSRSQADSALVQMKELVGTCEPLSPTDAITMLSSLARFVADVGEDDIDLTRLLVHLRVAQWANARTAAGMNHGTLSQHMLRLRRLMRVQCGLPARIGVRGAAKRASAPMSEADRERLEASFSHDSLGAMRAYVAAFGAHLIGGTAVAATFSFNVPASISTATGTRRILTPLQWLVPGIAGHDVGRDDWGLLRAHATSIGVRVNNAVARDTHAELAVREPTSLNELVVEFGVTRRQIDRGAASRRPVHPEVMRAVLRG